MSAWKGEIHWVTITETDDPDYPREFEVEHPASCVVIPGGMEEGIPWGESYDCGEQHNLDGIGPAEAFEDLPLGRSAFRAWGHGPDIWGDHDGGIEFVEEARAAVRPDTHT